MSRVYIPLILFLLLLLEGVALELLPTKLVMNNSIMVPHWVLIFLIFIAMFYDKRNTYLSVLYAVIFGLLIDIVYIEVLGVYMFVYAIVTYVIAELKDFVHGNLVVTIILCAVGLFLADILIYLVYIMIGIASVDWSDYFLYRLSPTIIANIIFALVLYPIMVNRLGMWKEKRFESNQGF